MRKETERRQDGRELIYYFAVEAGETVAPGSRDTAAPAARPQGQGSGETYLVTGGAGYVAGPLVARLVGAGHRVVVLDDLSTSTGRTLPPGAILVRAAVGDAVALREVLRRQPVAAIFHFAADSRVGESMRLPLQYYRHNVRASLTLLEEALAAGAPPIIFSSSAAVYGIPAAVPIPEDAPLLPINPSGETKACFERCLHWAAEAHGLRWAALRYFNAAGAEGAWEPKAPETHLIPNVLAAAAGGPPLRVFGDDYPTSDGTAVRDYIHVADLAEGHLAALRHLRGGGAPGAFNLGTGTGWSVAQVVAAAEAVTGRRVPREVAPRRPGDPPALVADPSKAERVLGWRAQRSGLREMVADAWQAMQAAQAGPVAEPRPDPGVRSARGSGAGPDPGQRSGGGSRAEARPGPGVRSGGSGSAEARPNPPRWTAQSAHSPDAGTGAQARAGESPR